MEYGELFYLLPQLKYYDFDLDKMLLINKRFFKKVVVCMVYLKYCPACKLAKPNFLRLRNKFNNFTFVGANLEDGKLSEALFAFDNSLLHVPTFYVFVNGRYVAKADSVEDLEKRIKN